MPCAWPRSIPPVSLDARANWDQSSMASAPTWCGSTISSASAACGWMATSGSWPSACPTPVTCSHEWTNRCGEVHILPDPKRFGKPMRISVKPSFAGVTILCRLLLLVPLFAWLPVRAADPFISEFVPDNASVSTDEDNQYVDLIEIQNPNATP